MVCRSRANFGKVLMLPRLFSFGNIVPSVQFDQIDQTAGIQLPKTNLGRAQEKRRSAGNIPFPLGSGAVP